MTAESDEWVPPKTSEEEAVEKARKTIIVESRRWLEELSGHIFANPSDFRGSLRNGIILCEVLNKLKPGCVKRINRRSTPIAGLDNLSVFLTTLQKDFGLSKSHLFDVTDLEDITEKYSGNALTVEDESRALKVTVTLYWLSQQLATSVLGGPSSAFSNDPSVTSVRPVDPSLFSAGNVIHRRQSSVFSDTESLASSGYVTSGMPVRHSAGFDSVCGTSLDSLDDSCSRPPSSSSAAASATSSGPPPRFHKPDASDLARAAERQMEVARMNRNLASSTAVAAKGDDDEWRSSLSSWRERRRQQTQGSYVSVPSVEEEEETVTEAPKPKPFRKIVDDNARRKRNFKFLYPLEDEDAGGISASAENRSNPERSLPLSTSLPDRAPWAAAEAEEPVVAHVSPGVQAGRSGVVTSSGSVESRFGGHSNGATPRATSPGAASSSSSEATPAPRGREKTATMRLTRRPREQRFGLQLGVGRGTVVVEKVVRGSTSDVNDVRKNDVVLTVDGEAVTSLDQANRLLAGTSAVQLRVRRSVTEEDEFEDFSDEEEEDTHVEMRSSARPVMAYRRSAPAPSTNDEVDDEASGRQRTPSSSGPKAATSASSLPHDAADGPVMNGRLGAVSEPQLSAQDEASKRAGVRQRISNIECRNSFFGVNADLEEKKYRELETSQGSRESSSERLTAALPWQRKCEFRPIKPRLTQNQLQLQQQQQKVEQEEERRQRQEREREERAREEEERRQRREEERKRVREEEEAKRQAEEEKRQREEEERRRVIEQGKRRREEEERRRQKEEEQRRQEEEERRRREEEGRRRQKEEDRRRREEEERLWQKEEEEQRRQREEEKKKQKEMEERRRREEEERMWQKEEEERLRQKEEERRWKMEEEERRRQKEEERRWKMEEEERRRQKEEERRRREEEEQRPKPVPPRTLPKPQKRFGDPERGVGEAEALQLLAGIAEMRSDMARFREQQLSNEAEIESVLSSSRSGGSGSPQQRLSREVAPNEAPQTDSTEMVAPPVSVRKQVQHLELLAQSRQGDALRHSQHTTSVSSTFSSVDPDTRGSASRHTSVSPTKSRSGENFHKSDEWIDRSRASGEFRSQGSSERLLSGSSASPPKSKQHAPLRANNRTTLSEVKSRHSPRTRDLLSAGDYEPPPRPKSLTADPSAGRQMLGSPEQCHVRPSTSENQLMSSSLPKDSCLPSYAQYQQHQQMLQRHHHHGEEPQKPNYAPEFQQQQAQQQGYHQSMEQSAPRKPTYPQTSQQQPLSSYASHDSSNHHSVGGYQPPHIQHHSLQHSPKHTYTQYSQNADAPPPPSSSMTTSMYDFNRPPAHMSMAPAASDDSVLMATNRSQAALSHQHQLQAQQRSGSSSAVTRIPNSHSVDSGLVHHARIQPPTPQPQPQQQPPPPQPQPQPQPPSVTNPVYATHAHEPKRAHGHTHTKKESSMQPHAHNHTHTHNPNLNPTHAHPMHSHGQQPAANRQHWLVEEALRRQKAEREGFRRLGPGEQPVTPHHQHHQHHQPPPPPPSHPPGITSPGNEPPPALPPRMRTSAEAALRQRTRPVLNSRAPCCACNQPLGTGDLMTIESLQLSFHLACFRCVACNTRLGSGRQDADVRVRGNRLYCFNCSAMEEA